MNYIIKKNKSLMINYILSAVFLLIFFIALSLDNSMLNINVMDKNVKVIVTTFAVVVYLGGIVASLQYYKFKKDKHIIYYLIYFVFGFLIYFTNQTNLFNKVYEHTWIYLCFINKVLILLSIIPNTKSNKKDIFKISFIFLCLSISLSEIICYNFIPNSEIVKVLFFLSNFIYIYVAIINLRKFMCEKNYLYMILSVFLLVNFLKNIYILMFLNSGFTVNKYATMAILMMFMNLLMYIIGILFIGSLNDVYELRDIQDWDAFYDIFDDELKDKEIYFIGENWNMIYANKAARKRHGIEGSDINSLKYLCEKCRECINNIDYKYYKEMKESVENNKEWSGFITHDGEEILVEVKIKQSKYYGQISVVQVNYNKEIINLKKEIDARNKFFDNITEKSGDLIVIVDKNKNIKYVNDAVYRTLEYSKNEIIGRQITDFLVDSKHDIKDNIIFEHVSVKCKNKKIIDVETLGTTTNDGWMLVCRNITIRRELELLKEEYEEIKVHQQLKDEFFSNLSHELKTPLNIFYSTIQILDLNLKKSDKEFKQVYERYNNVLRTNFYRMFRMITNLIDLSKLNSNFGKVKFENYDIVKLCEDVTLSVVNFAQQRNINLIFDTEEEEHIIKCDGEYIERIMLNLLSNGIKYTPNNGEIFVNLTFNEEYVHISVKDNGIGIPKEKLNSVFEKFVRVDKSLRRENEGSGIGLSIVKSLVDLLGGNIYIKSEENVGSEFIIELPNEKLEDKVKNYNIDEQNVNLELSDIYS